MKERTIKKLNNEYKITQSGRSMTEMLGVLAVVGVLSIGGIMGYSYAMDKHRANETINEIMLRLNTLQMQSERDMELNLNEFSDTTSLGYVIGDNYDWAEDDTRVYVGISGLSEQVCNIIYDEMINRVERIDVTADKTANVNTFCGDNNEMRFYIVSGVEATCDPACGENEICADGQICVKNEKTDITTKKCTTNEDCGECAGTCQYYGCWNHVPLNGKECDNGNGICTNGRCLPKAEKICETNDDCPTGEYCAIKNQWDCKTPVTYGCAPIELVQKTITLSNGKQETWFLSKHSIDWWNAKAMCDAVNKDLPTRAELEYLDRGPKLRSAGGSILWTKSETSCGMVWCFQSATSWPNQGKGNSQFFSAVCR